MPLEPSAAVAAYQRLRLLEIRSLYDELDLDLEHYLDIERGIAKEIDPLEEEFGEIRTTLSALGAELSEPGHDSAPVDATVPGSQGSRYKRIDVERAGNFRELVKQAESYLAETGVDLNRDPLLQVLGSSEIAQIGKHYRDSYGDVSWDRSDYLIVILAGVVATLLDIFLVRIPTDVVFLGRMRSGSPLTKWIRENSKSVHEHYLNRLESIARVPYDLSVGKAVGGLSPKVHRLMSPGHDPILGFIVGVIDIISGTGTFIDKNGDVRRIDTLMSPESLIIAFLKVFLHLLSDVCTSAGIQPPFFTLLQLVKAQSPFVLGLSGEKVSWTNVARYMYAHGYDLRHFATMGIVPASVEMIVRGWWLCGRFENKDESELAKLKLTSMLLLGHAVATSGNLLKTSVIYGMNPLALNWAEMLALFPVTMAWMRESLKRDRAIRDRLDAEWVSIYQTNLGHSA
jgi:membrane-bound metal-dependent hydrolase YbcI (DUF457 family)